MDGQDFLFDVDLQGYLDGYFALTIAYQKAKFDMVPAEPVFAVAAIAMRKPQVTILPKQVGHTFAHGCASVVSFTLKRVR